MANYVALICVYKQSELASRDTTSPHFLHEINSAGFRP